MLFSQMSILYPFCYPGALAYLWGGCYMLYAHSAIKFIEEEYPGGDDPGGLGLFWLKKPGVRAIRCSLL